MKKRTHASVARTALVVAAAMVLPACGMAAGQGASRAPAAAVTAGKPGSGIQVRLVSPATYASGATARLTLEVKTPHPGARLAVTWRAEDGLALEGPEQATLTADGAGLAQGSVTVRGVQDGRRYLNVFVTEEHEGARAQRAVSLALVFGEASVTKKSDAAYVTTPSGESLVIVPASPR